MNDELLQAIARGWTHPKNINKVMDEDLVVAIAAEVQRLFAAMLVKEMFG